MVLEKEGTIRIEGCDPGNEFCYIEYDIKKIPHRFYQAMQMAVTEANRLLNNELFLGLIESHVDNYAKSFDADGGVNGPEIVQMIKKYPGSAHEIDRRYTGKTHIVGYTSKWPWSKTLAYVGRTPELIHVNLRNLARSLRSIMATLIHEFIHVLDKLNKNAYFGHVKNSASGNSKTANYWIAQLAMDF